MAKLVYSILICANTISFILFTCLYFYKVNTFFKIQNTLNSDKNDCMKPKIVNISDPSRHNACEMYKDSLDEYLVFVIGYLLLFISYLFAMVTILKKAFPLYSSRVNEERFYQLLYPHELWLSKVNYIHHV